MQNKNWLLIAVFVYLIAILLRFYYPFVLGEFEEYFYHNALLLNTNDGYFYAQGARDILAGVKSTFYSPTHEILSQISAFLALILPFSLEQIIFYMPGFFGSLIVFFVVFVSRDFGGIPSFLCGILSAIGVSYYNRTMFGYYDTDMLVIVLAFGVGVVIVELMRKISFFGLVLLILLSGFGLVYYPSMRYIFVGYVGILTIFGIFDRNIRMVNGCLLSVLLGFLLFSTHFVFWLFLCFCGVMIKFIQRLDRRIFDFVYCLLLVIFCGILAFRVVPEIFASVYVAQDSKETLGFGYASVMGTISEVSKIDFWNFIYRISGNLLWFVLGSVGIILLFLKKREFWIFLPFLIMGFFGYFGGLRFTFYAVVVYALGIGYLLCFLLDIFKRKIKWAVLFGIVFVCGSIFPHLWHIKNYIISPILENSEAKALQEIPAKYGDYALAWWDYGYFVRYFARLNTFVDGGIHSGKQNYPISFVLSAKNQKQSYNMAKLTFNHIEFEDFAKSHQYSQSKALEALKGDIDCVGKRSEDLYIILPLRMVRIFSTIMQFSQPKGEINQGLLMVSKTKSKDKIIFQDNVFVDIKKGKVGILNQEISLNLAKMIDLKDSSKSLEFDKNSSLVVLMLGGGDYILCDKEYLETFYFRGMFLDNLDSNLFEKVLKNEKIAIYKLKQ